METRDGEKTIWEYAGKVRELEDAVEVRLSPGDDVDEVITIISSEPQDDRARMMVLETQADIMGREQPGNLRFQLVNLRELPEPGAEPMVRAGTTIWSRDGVFTAKIAAALPGTSPRRPTRWSSWGTWWNPGGTGRRPWRTRGEPRGCPGNLRNGGLGEASPNGPRTFPISHRGYAGVTPGGKPPSPPL